MTTRPDWDWWAVGLAQAAAERADCTRRKVGAVVLDLNHRVIGVGYNGAPSGEPGCLTAGACPRGRHYLREGSTLGGRDVGVCGCGQDWPCPDAAKALSSYDTGGGSCIAVHAEQNAVLDADPVRRQGGTLYVTCQPCDGCWRMIKAAGISLVVWPQDGTIVYRSL
jgi:dCMP deaminase